MIQFEIITLLLTPIYNDSIIIDTNPDLCTSDTLGNL